LTNTDATEAHPVINEARETYTTDTL